MSAHLSFEIPVVLLVFNRPENTRLVLECIRSVRPRRLFVVADGPRECHPHDATLTEKVRDIIRTGIDWRCEVDLNFRNRNLGCARSVAEGLDRIFGCVESAIVLEDDTVVSASFFSFCAELLERYKDDTRIGCIAANNFQRGKPPENGSYYFSRYPHCWGWASWRRAWKWYDHSMKDWPEIKRSGRLRSMVDSNVSERYWQRVFDDVYHDRVSSWAYRWTFSLWCQSALTVLPSVNMVRNLGVVGDGTHCFSTALWWTNLGANEMAFPLNHPRVVLRDRLADSFTDAYVLRGGRLWQRALRKAKRMLRRCTASLSAMPASLRG